ncbi:hypothetical protein N7517_001720 [Penicillium concentricum]|uniref:Major facilitator superfamily (MFS) profile domain-containing protein n=1 Tax=Penicillium concentricum TaxID=293559 RepID=A0A9W9SUK4_9EURO|nr:uncharacterized protein N7517_001720 [Penicillium concentricum]KAJ5383809.1 hypothetical protein N7517_001720 [Penicillium concentricum]
MGLGIIQVNEDHAPGTFQMDGSSSNLTTQMKYGTGKHSTVVLVPQPSNSPNDPLNWPQWKKNLIYVVLFFNSIIFSSIPPPVIAPSMVLMSMALKRSIKDITMLTAYQLLATACYGPVGSALAHKYGKRPQFIFAAIMGFVGTLICCNTTENYGALLAGRIIQGFGSAVFESLTVAVMGDMFFVHERSLRTGLLVMTWTCIISLVSILGGTIAEHLGWRYVFIIHLPLTVIGLVSVVFLLPETQWKGTRPDIFSPEAMAQADEKEMTKTSHGHEENLTEQSEREFAETKKTYFQELALFSGTHTDANVLRLVFAPFAVIINPAVIWSIAVGGACIGFYVAVSYILAQIWSAPPYLLNASQNGTFYVGALIGGVISSIGGPWLGDSIAKKLTEWNKGTYEPEFRIPMMALSALFCGIGWFVFMWDLDNPTPNGYYLGAFCHGCLCCGTTIGMTFANLYILDAFRENSTEIFILLMTAKNFIFYGFSQVINTWAEEKGPSDVLKTFGIITMCLIGTSPILYMFGKINRSFMYKSGLMSMLTGYKH